MVPITRLYADDDGHARFEDIEIPLVPDDPPPDAMSVSQPWPAAAVLLGHGPAGGSHPRCCLGPHRFKHLARRLRIEATYSV